MIGSSKFQTMRHLAEPYLTIQHLEPIPAGIINWGTFSGAGVFMGSHALSPVYLVPTAVLGVLLLFAGSQPAITFIDMKERKEMFVALVMLGITLVSNLAVGFISGVAVAYALKSYKLKV